MSNLSQLALFVHVATRDGLYRLTSSAQAPASGAYVFAFDEQKRPLYATLVYEKCPGKEATLQSAFPNQLLNGSLDQAFVDHAASILREVAPAAAWYRVSRFGSGSGSTSLTPAYLRPTSPST